MKIINLSILLSLGLVGCSSYSNDFDCPIGQGLNCASLSEVNQKIDDGTWPQDSGPKADCPNCHKVYWRSDLSPRTVR